MNITKLGHSCMLLEENHLRILLDPGAYSTLQNDVTEIDLILITHEHPDHVDPESLKTVLKHNPGVKIITNRGVGKVLKEMNVDFEILEDGKNMVWQNVMIEAAGDEHAEIYKTMPRVVNTGYIISSRFFYPGDRLYQPKRHVDILALPVAAPWMRLSEAIDYALKMKPKVCFPVHDGMLKHPGPVHRISKEILAGAGIEFMVLEEGKGVEV